MYFLKFAIIGLCLSGGIVRSQVYRSVDHEKFRVVDTAGFNLYCINKLVQGEKIARPQDVYYFSVKEDGPILELTRENLDKAFGSNPRFRYAIAARFRRDKELMEYDRSLGTYALKYLYRQSLH